ncbi:hypothetical protein SALB1_2761 [Salinisphaera sp. LB1]|nr:hypothetical protein SALB1_2761 [Salinisphaera sp. LB1]
MPVRFSDTIHVTFRPSSALRLTSLAVHGAAFAVVTTLAVSRPVLGFPALLVVFSAIRCERALGLRRPGVPVRLRWAADHRLYWQDRAGRAHYGECIEARHWGAAWVRLKMRIPGRRFARAIIIPFDAVDADVHRRLRARCRVMPPARRT